MDLASTKPAAPTATKPCSTSSFFNALIDAEIAVWNRIERDLWATPDSATLARYLTLRTITTAQDDDGTPVCIHDIATTQHTTVGAASRLADRLEKDGLITRTPDANDRRTTRLTITDEGRKRFAIADTVFQTTLSKILTELPQDQIATLIPLLARITEAAEHSTSTPNTATSTPRQRRAANGRQITKSTNGEQPQ